MSKTTFIVILITVISKLLGFSRELVLSYFYGVSNVSDAYLISTTIPGVFFGFIAASLAAGFIPILSEIEYTHGEEKSVIFTNNLINILLIVSTVVIILGLLYTDKLVKLFASGFEGELLKLTIDFTRITLFAIYFKLIVTILCAYLQVKNNFIIPAFVALPLNLVIIFSIYISTYNLMMLAIGFLLASISQIFFLIPSLLKKKYKYLFRLNINDDYVKELLFLSAPVIIGVSVNQINVLVDRTLASQLVIGGISALNYANRLNSFTLSVFVLSLVTVNYPKMSKKVLEDDISGLINIFTKITILTCTLVLPIMMGTFIFSREIVVLLFERGAFDADAVALTSSVFFYYTIGLLAFGLREILSRVFYALKDSRTPVLNATIGMFLNIILNLILSRCMGVAGLALATSIAAIVTTILLIISLKIKIGKLGLKKIIITVTKLIVASIIMVGITKKGYRLLLMIMAPSISLIIAIIFSILLYFVLLLFMKVNEIDDIVKSFYKKLKLGKL